ncbi:MAG: hypothetical protein AAF357_07165 [Verrucomicrobiota bacterium]
MNHLANHCGQTWLIASDALGRGFVETRVKMPQQRFVVPNLSTMMF